ncbi:NVEALA domain-containing protein [Proteiniphilum sp. UBA1028]|jgi:hypothetical protein|uniref:NVEALA domain-containing protein n=1 Tax=Proteiniphilum sp. UBA1028 TaxID=1947251 RepID=UPI0025F74F3F|nr:NVEALA domain-containing protein [Proteiniphilum sp. UBA1028]
MKKKHHAYLIIVTMTTLLIFSKSKVKNQYISEILLSNIECLATSENPNINCFGLGSVDCPKSEVKVLLYF